LNAIVLDLTSDLHYITLQYDGEIYEFSFNEKQIAKRNNWGEKIETLKKSVPEFDFNKLDKMAYAAGPGSYTGARLAYTFLQTIELILEKKFYAFSNLSALNLTSPEKIPVIKGNKNDFFYRYMGKDFYCDSVEDIPKGQYIGLKRDQLALESLEQVDGNAIPTNILRMLLKDDNHELTSNFPNYIKELSYTKS
jgi:tRNA A37 threonylcarbamoyladenosine modification protein TsaB